MNWSTSVRPLRSWSVLLLGVALLGVTLGYAFSGGETTWVGFVRTSLPIALSLVTLALGVQVQRTMNRPQCDRVLLWCLLGGLVTVLVTDWIIFVERNGGRSISRPIPLLVSAVSVGFVGGGLFGVYSVRLHERTRELAERTEDLREKNHRLDEFSRIVSHDLRNPIAVAQGHLELARETDETEHFETVRRAHTRMERLIDEVWAFARHGVSMQEPVPVRLDAVAEAAWETSATRDAELEIESSHRILADERRLRTLFENLFRNAVEHGSTSPGSHARQDAVEYGSTSPPSPDEGVREDAVERGMLNEPPVAGAPEKHLSRTPGSHLSEDSLSNGGGEVTVTVGATEAGFFVADDGSGIPADEREHVFEAGYSLSASGTGMGLTIVRSIVDSHDWDCHITDSTAGGARFEFTGVERPESQSP